jgi:hypothetical protein
MPREAKFNFTSFLQVEKLMKEKELERQTVSVNTRYGMITFSKAYVQEKGLDGRFLLFFVDVEKKALAWKKIDVTTLTGMVGARKLIGYLTNGVMQYKLSIRKILKSFGFRDDYAFNSLIIDSYAGSIIDGEVDYVVLKDGIRIGKDVDSIQESLHTSLNRRPEEVCDECRGTGEVSEDVYNPDSHQYEPVGSRPCPKCHPKKEEDPDAFHENERDNNL